MPEVEYWQILRVDGGELIELYARVHYELGKVTGFVFQLCIRAVGAKEDQRQIIRRYDCKHGFPHYDVYNASGDQIRKEAIVADSIHEASLKAEQDLKAHWRRYVEEYQASIERRR